jgi:hypothetical protein
MGVLTQQYPQHIVLLLRQAKALQLRRNARMQPTRRKHHVDRGLREFVCKSFAPYFVFDAHLMANVEKCSCAENYFFTAPAQLGGKQEHKDRFALGDP